MVPVALPLQPFGSPKAYVIGLGYSDVKDRGMEVHRHLDGSACRWNARHTEWPIHGVSVFGNAAGNIQHVLRILVALLYFFWAIWEGTREKKGGFVIGIVLLRKEEVEGLGLRLMVLVQAGGDDLFIDCI